MITGVGAKPVRIDIEQHDRAVALTSHLPQLLASSLAVLAARRGARCAAGPAFADATRVAGGPERVWRDIFETNADEVAAALRELIATLEPLAGELEQHQVAATLDLLDAARSSRKQ